jgi:hypothetical protein
MGTSNLRGRAAIAGLLVFAAAACWTAATFSRGPAIHPAAAEPVPLREGEVRGPSVREVDWLLNGPGPDDWIESPGRVPVRVRGSRAAPSRP